MQDQKVTIEEIPVERIDDFWKVHYEYLIRDGIVTDEEGLSCEIDR